PATRTRARAVGSPSRGCWRASFTERPSYAVQLRSDRLALCGNLLVGEGAVAGSELEPQSEALAALAHLLTFIEVEHIAAPQQLAAPGHDRIAYLCRRGAAGHDRSQVLPHGRKGGHVLEDLLAGGGCIDQRRQIHFEADRRLQVPLATDERVQLADPAGIGLADHDLRRAPPVPEGLGRRLKCELTAN